MNKEYLAEILKARYVLCGYCETYECDKCHVLRLVNDALDEMETEEEYVPSSTNGDYSPGNPWDAPGMSPSDFI